MHLLILTTSPLHKNAGAQARLKTELGELSRINKITIICLGSEPENGFILKKYSHVKFIHSPITYNGWNVLNSEEICNLVIEVCQKENIDLVVLEMEIWDLMRELGIRLLGVTPFATRIHAMPFLSAPTNPSGDFQKDVLQYANSVHSQYKKDYILAHHHECEDVFDKIYAITHNRTVDYYLKLYFPALPTWLLSASLSTMPVLRKPHTEVVYDFVYMARFEEGKGLEYLHQILAECSRLLGRSIKIAVMGKIDDEYSNKLVQGISSDENIEVNFLGWADDALKDEVFSQSKIFIYPSINDNFPTVLNEALAHSLPAVTWAVPYSTINYSNTKAVLMAELGNITEFAELCLRAMSEQANLTVEADRFVDSFDRPAMVAEKDTGIFKEILNHAKFK